MNIKVSVIIPVYNEEKYLTECLDSVTKQTLKEIEVICIDDGSEDHSAQIIQKYMADYPYIKLIFQKNQGAGIARNRGLLCARGEFVCFLDADDYYISSNALEVLYHAAIEEQVSVCAGLLQAETKEKIEKNCALRRLLKEKERTLVRYRDFQYDYHYQCYLFQREMLKRYHITFPDYKRFQDPPFFVQAMFFAEKFVIVRIEFYFYRLVSGKILFTDQKIYDLFQGLLFNLGFAKRNHLETLFRLTVQRINQDCFDVLYQGLEDRVAGLESEFEKGKRLAEEEQMILEPLELYWLKKKERNSDFVFGKLEKQLIRGTSLILYGAGEVGKRCFLYLKNSGYANVVMWVDHYKWGERCFSEMLHDVGDIKKVEFDLVFIAIRDAFVAGEIEKNLLAMGVEEKKLTKWNDHFMEV